ncbi:unnamed protein product [Leptosia nina]|uniref:Uncharacterized protein n=1 Tax=Leptosia nina TaxID=320188 RepID=A0AAV1J3N5_9NEOP
MFANDVGMKSRNRKWPSRVLHVVSEPLGHRSVIVFRCRYGDRRFISLTLPSQLTIHCTGLTHRRPFPSTLGLSARAAPSVSGSRGTALRP